MGYWMRNITCIGVDSPTKAPRRQLREELRFLRLPFVRPGLDHFRNGPIKSFLRPTTKTLKAHVPRARLLPDRPIAGRRPLRSWNFLRIMRIVPLSAADTRTWTVIMTHLAENPHNAGAELVL